MKNQHVISKQAQYEQLKAGIGNNRGELEALILKDDQLKRDEYDAKNRFNGYSGDKDDPNFQRLAGEAKNVVDRISADRKSNLDKIEALRQQIAADENVLKTFKFDVEITDFVSLHQAIKAEELEAEKLINIIVDKQLFIDETSQHTDTAGPLKQQRIQLLAEAATGIDHAKKLSALDNDIAKAEQVDKQTVNEIEKATETLQGLRNMLTSAEKSIVSKRQTLRYMLDSILGQSLAIEAHRYHTAADILATSHRKISAFEYLIAKVGIRQESGAIVQRGQNLIIPALVDMPTHPEHQLFYYGSMGMQPNQADIEQVVQELNAQGIEVAEWPE